MLHEKGTTQRAPRRSQSAIIHFRGHRSSYSLLYLPEGIPTSLRSRKCREGTGSRQPSRPREQRAADKSSTVFGARLVIKWFTYERPRCDQDVSLPYLSLQVMACTALWAWLCCEMVVANQHNIPGDVHNKRDTPPQLAPRVGLDEATNPWCSMGTQEVKKRLSATGEIFLPGLAIKTTSIKLSSAGPTERPPCAADSILWRKGSIRFLPQFMYQGQSEEGKELATRHEQKLPKLDSTDRNKKQERPAIAQSSRPSFAPGASLKKM